MRTTSEWNAARGEDIAWFVATGADLDEAARRLQITTEAVVAWCRRHGFADELEVLRDRQALTPSAAHARNAAMARWQAERADEKAAS